MSTLDGDAQGGKVIDPHITHTSTTGSFVKNQWYYTTFVKHDNGTGQIYIDGVLKATSTGNQHTPINSLTNCCESHRRQNMERIY